MLGKHSCMSSPFPIAILNVPSFFAKRHDRNGRRVACQKLSIIIIISTFISRHSLDVKTKNMETVDWHLYIRNIIIIIIIIIIIKRGRRCEAGRVWSTPYQSKDPSPTMPTYGEEKEKWENNGRQKWIEQLTPIKKKWPWSWYPTPSNTGYARLFHRDTEKGITVLRYCEGLQRGIE